MHDQKDLAPRTLVLPDERPLSWNAILRLHKMARDYEVNRVNKLVRAELDPNTPMFDCRVDVLVIAYFDKRPHDSSNIPAKLYEDGLRTWWIENDTMKFVRRVSTESRIDKDNPRVEITLTPVLED